MSDVNFVIDRDRKFSNNFKLTDTLAGFINNKKFGNSFAQIGSGSEKYSDSYIWKAISAVGDDVANTIYENVLNYIDNISNVDLCKVKALQSLVNMHGIKYSVLNSIESLPLEIRNLMDTYSINKKYLIKHGILADEYTSTLQDNLIDQDVSFQISAAKNALSNFSDTDISCISHRIKNDYEEKTYYNYLSNLYETTILCAVNAKFIPNELEDTYINTTMSAVCSPIWRLYQEEFSHKEEYTNQLSAVNIRQFKLINGISPLFDEVTVVDNINNGSDSLSNYEGPTLELLKLEKHLRETPYDPTIPTSKYMIAKKNKVKEYFDFVEWRYRCINSVNDIADIYKLDAGYIELSTTTQGNEYNLLISEFDNYHIDTQKIDRVANNLAGITIYISKIREYLKYQAQKNYMKGTYNLLTFTISMFLKQLGESNFFNMFGDSQLNTDYIVKKLTTVSQSDIDVIEYSDPTEYYNISSIENDDPTTSPRYWEMTTNGDGCFTDQEIEEFYREKLNCHDSHFDISDFLNTVYSAGASKSYGTMQNPHVEGVTPEISAANYTILLSYNGNSYGYYPYCNNKNLVHPSYQLHPYLKSFTKYVNYRNAIKNAFTNTFNDVLEDELVMTNLSSVIGEYGQTINVAMNHSFDYSGYMTNYEHSPHYENLVSSAVIDYDGAFFPAAVTDYLNDKDEFISQISTTYTDSDKIDTYFEKYYSHLGASKKSYERIAAQLSEYYGEIYNLTKPQSALSNVYDIFKYGRDRYDNKYILYKKYSVENPTYQQKLNTLGQLWIRLKNHPIAFPAFYGKIPAVDTEPGKLNGNIELLASPLLVNDEKKMSYIYDFEFDEQLRTIMLVVQPDNIRKSTNSEYYRSIQHSDLIMCNINEEVDQFEKYTKLQLTSDKVQYIGRMPNPIVDSVFKSAIDIPWEISGEISSKTVPCYLGMMTNKSNIDCVYVDKKMVLTPDNALTYMMPGYDTSVYLYRYSFENENKMYKGKFAFGNSNYQDAAIQQSILHEFRFADDSTQFTHSNNGMTFAFLVSPTSTNLSCQTYAGLATDTGKIDLSAATSPSPSVDNSFELLDNYIMTFDVDPDIDDSLNSTIKFNVKQIDIYNVHGDESFMPQYPGIFGKTDMSRVDEYKKDLWYSLQFLGNSNTLQPTLDMVGHSININELMTTINDQYGSVFEDYNNDLSSNKPFSVIKYSIKDKDTWKIDLSDYDDSALSHMNLVLFNSIAGHRNIYYSGEISSLQGTPTSVKALGKYDDSPVFSEISVNENTIQLAGTLSPYTSETTHQGSNNLFGVSDIELSADDTTLVVKFVNAGNFLVRDSEVQAILYNKNNVYQFEKSHFMDPTGAYVGIPPIRYDLSGNMIFNPDDFSSVTLSTDDLSSCPQVSGQNRLAFKYYEQDVFSPSSLNWYYPGDNEQYPNSFISELVKQSNASMPSLTKMFDGLNTYIFKITDSEIIDRIGEIAIPTMNDETESYRVFEDYLSTDTDGVENQHKYDENDLRIVEFSHLFEDETTTPESYQKLQDLIDRNRTTPEYLSSYVGWIESIGLSVSTVEQGTMGNNDYYDFTPVYSDVSADIDKLLTIYANYEYENDGSITLYFNYQNFIDPPFVNIDSNGVQTLAPLPGSYLKLKSGQNGILDIIIQFKRPFGDSQLYGYRNVKIASYQIYNISDDKPKVLIYKLSELQNDSSYKFDTTRNTLAIEPENNTLVFEDMTIGEDDKISFVVDVDVKSTYNLSALSYNIVYPYSDITYVGNYPSTLGIVQVSGDTPTQLEFQTNLTYSELTSQGKIQQYTFECNNTVAIDNSGKTIDAVEGIGITTMKYTTYIRLESTNPENLLSGEINSKIGNTPITGIKTENTI